MDSISEKVIKEMIKKVIDDNNSIPNDAKKDLKTIIELENDPEKLFRECLLYMLFYKS